MNNLAPVNRQLYLGTCWKLDLNPHITEPSDKWVVYFRAENRDADGCVVGTRLTRKGDWIALVSGTTSPAPKLGMTQIDSLEFSNLYVLWMDQTW